MEYFKPDRIKPKHQEVSPLKKNKLHFKNPDIIHTDC